MELRRAWGRQDTVKHKHIKREEQKHVKCRP
jgi:hypothetical protein